MRTVDHQVVGAVLVANDKVLLCRRSTGRASYPGVWDIPGGHIEEGEGPEEALRRELKEELGINLPECSADRLAVVIVPGKYDLTVYLIRSWRGSPVNLAPDEHDEICWFSADALGSLEISHPDILSVLVDSLGNHA